ncbi:murein transglycosylase A [Oryzibacter oryziterrae]|uniref:murein transglycosylase A n=1 Tax=Oryzibacter oryziterrae TaxID=2766474 RepID=UPI001F01A93A|nr:MltA domain-containing protein [Oryzibacter oryziterrae]
MSEPAIAELVPVDFADLEGWAADDHRAAFAAFRLSAARIVDKPPKTKPLGPEGTHLVAAAKAALLAGETLTAADARVFFETHFQPHRVIPAEGSGFVTAYFEPEVDGALEASAAFPVPLYGRPADLVELGPDDDRSGLDPVLTWARRLPDGGIAEYPDRGAIMDGAIAGSVPVLAYVANWVEALFIHVQGSARIRVSGGGVRRLTFTAKSGHPYFPVARVMVERGLCKPAEATADVMKAWLLGLSPDEARAVIGRNRSFIFFREALVPDPALGPIAAADVPLSPGRSLAVDRHLVTFHVPIFVEADIDAPVGAFRRLMIAQDTGSAILGPARGDIFFGTGEAAWHLAARVRHPARFTQLVPREPKS